jgi:hypothetical protein
VQRLDKLLEDAGIKLSSVACDITGVSGRAMLEALIAAERDPAVIAELAQRRMRSKIPALTQALTGRFSDRHTPTDTAGGSRPTVLTSFWAPQFSYQFRTPTPITGLSCSS